MRAAQSYRLQRLPPRSILTEQDDNRLSAIWTNICKSQLSGQSLCVRELSFRKQHQSFRSDGGRVTDLNPCPPVIDQSGSRAGRESLASRRFNSLAVG